MSQYRLDVPLGDDLHSEFFHAPGHDTAAERARQVIHALPSNPGYGVLYVVDGFPAGAFTQCSYVADVEVDQ